MPFGGLLTAGIAGVGSVVSGIIGGSAASKAANQQRQAGLAAANGVNQAVGTAAGLGYAGIAQSNNAINNGLATSTNAINSGVNLANQEIAGAGQLQSSIYGDMVNPLQPYQAAGTYGLSQLQNTAGTFSFNPQNLENDPGYQFQLQQGMKALNNQASASGTLQSGGQLKALENYSQGLAGTSYQNAYNRALTTYNTNQQGFQTLANLGTTANSQNLQAGATYGGQVGQLAGLQSNVNLQGAGLTTQANTAAEGLLANTALQGNEWIGNQTMTGANLAGNFLTGAGNAQAAGTIGQANAWGNAIGGVANAATGYLGLSNMAAGPSTLNPSSGSYYNSPPISTSNMPNPFGWSGGIPAGPLPAGPSYTGPGSGVYEPAPWESGG